MGSFLCAAVLTRAGCVEVLKTRSVFIIDGISSTPLLSGSTFGEEDGPRWVKFVMPPLGTRETGRSCRRPVNLPD